MTARRRWRVAAAVVVTAAIPIVIVGQESRSAERLGGPLSPTVIDAPFSAEATTTARLRFRDGATLRQTSVARYCRDTSGRARVEFVTDGLDRPAEPRERRLTTVIGPEPTSGLVQALDIERRTAHYLPRFAVAFAAGGAHAFAVPVDGVRFVTFRRAQDLLARNSVLTPVGYIERTEPLGTRVIAGVETVGVRVMMTIPPGQRGNDTPIDLVDERWESPDLKLLIAADFSDSAIGEVSYRLANIRRVEPPSDLFVVPAGYAVVNQATFDAWMSLTAAEGYTAARAARRVP